MFIYPLTVKLKPTTRFFCSLGMWQVTKAGDIEFHYIALIKVTFAGGAIGGSLGKTCKTK